MEKTLGVHNWSLRMVLVSGGWRCGCLRELAQLQINIEILIGLITVLEAILDNQATA